MPGTTVRGCPPTWSRSTDWRANKLRRWLYELGQGRRPSATHTNAGPEPWRHRRPPRQGRSANKRGFGVPEGHVPGVPQGSMLRAPPSLSPVDVQARETTLLDTVGNMGPRRRSTSAQRLATRPAKAGRSSTVSGIHFNVRQGVATFGDGSRAPLAVEACSGSNGRRDGENEAHPEHSP